MKYFNSKNSFIADPYPAQSARSIRSAITNLMQEKGFKPVKGNFVDKLVWNGS